MRETPVTATDNPGKILIPIARAIISNALGKPYNATNEDLPWLHEKGASFVTLTQNEQLRGCIGTLEAHRPLLIDVKANAHAAAFRDPRFSPLTVHELDSTEIEISLLSAMQPLVFSGEHDALAQLQPGVDGIVFEFGHYRSTFLPQVWEQLPEADVFMAHLKHKAGLQPGFWDEEVKLYRYSVSKWKERDITKEVEVLNKRV
ncbi:MAG TPA: AmmeMemoRadiSam system protein A [Methylotenera sp.]|nr:AmmeMemoRadiSam system protein A [Methylotenera sp.]HPV45004.1 AmmeMemoRadiSam system protein A [Methylotenera sp.]